MTFVWRPGWPYNVTATTSADTVLASNCHAHFGRPSTRRGCRMCVTVRFPVWPRGETEYWQANANTHHAVTTRLNLPENKLWTVTILLPTVSHSSLASWHITFQSSEGMHPKKASSEWRRHRSYSVHIFQDARTAHTANPDMIAKWIWALPCRPFGLHNYCRIIFSEKRSERETALFTKPFTQNAAVRSERNCARAPVRIFTDWARSVYEQEKPGTRDDFAKRARRQLKINLANIFQCK